VSSVVVSGAFRSSRVAACPLRSRLENVTLTTDPGFVGVYRNTASLWTKATELSTSPSTAVTLAGAVSSMVIGRHFPFVRSSRPGPGGDPGRLKYRKWSDGAAASGFRHRNG
jgi:hypothetical protein